MYLAATESQHESEHSERSRTGGEALQSFQILILTGSSAKTYDMFNGPWQQPGAGADDKQRIVARKESTAQMISGKKPHTISTMYTQNCA
jgi:hypothetical protein